MARWWPVLAAIPWWVAGPLIGALIGLVAALMIPPISRRRGVEKARREGALWSGLANFDAKEAGQAAVVQQALSGVGSLFGSWFTGDRRRPVGGRLFVFPDHIRWRPTLWLGRGRPKPWRLGGSEVTDLEIAKSPPPAVGSYEATVQTPQGPIRFLIVDPEGLQSAIDRFLA